MKTEDIFDSSELPEWDDAELMLSLESARSNLIALRRRHPNSSKNIPSNPPSVQSMLAKAKHLHALKKTDSMTTISIESYAVELDLDPEIRVLLENMRN